MKYLTVKEQNVLNGIFVGLSCKEMAKLFDCSIRCIHQYATQIRLKLRAFTIPQIVLAAHRVGEPIRIGKYIRFPIYD